MARAPELPPLIAGHRLEPSSDPLAIAREEAASGSARAGDLYWRDDDHRLDCAVVLEPDAGAAHCEVVHLATMVALGDSIGALSPPEVGVFYRWPGAICVNGAVVGAARLVVGPRAGAAAPAWLVTGVDVRIRAAEPDFDPGHTPDRTTLWEEGCGGLHLVPFLESFARHLNAWIHTFETDGARNVHEAWLARAEGRGDTVTVRIGRAERTGRFIGLDESGGLLLETGHGTELVALKDALT